MTRAGVHHVGLTTHKPDETIQFYTEKLGWKLVINDMLYPPSGGHMRHMFFDSGDGSFFAFLSPKDVPGIPADFATDISSAVGLPPGFYHIALWVDDVDALARKREWLIERGLTDVSPIVDHDFARSIYFRDPNGLQLEYCATSRPFTEADADLNAVGGTTVLMDDPEEAAKLMEHLMGVAAVKPDTAPEAVAL
jgi:catechol 2,3-dioxygenase-like lactoylglutathione lyase family enzyme